MNKTHISFLAIFLMFWVSFCFPQEPKNSFPATIYSHLLKSVKNIKFANKRKEILKYREQFLELLKLEDPSTKKEKQKLFNKIQKLSLEIDTFNKENNEYKEMACHDLQSTDYNTFITTFMATLKRMQGYFGDKKKLLGNMPINSRELLRLVYCIEVIRKSCTEEAHNKNHAIVFHREIMREMGLDCSSRSFQCNPDGDIYVYLGHHGTVKGLGQGKYKSVSMVLSINSGKIYAKASGILAGPSGQLDQVKVQKFEQEKQFLQRVENVPGLLGTKNFVYYLGSKQGKKVPKYAIIMELQDGSLQDFLIERSVNKKIFPNRKDLFELKDKLSIFMDVIDGLVGLEKLRIQHRDIKPQNIFLKRDENGIFRAKLGDFGLSRNIDDANEGDRHALKGTLRYMAPERVMAAVKRSQDENYIALPHEIGPTNDLYEAGVSLYELILGEDFPWIGVGDSVEKIIETQKILYENKKHIDFLRPLIGPETGRSGSIVENQLKLLIWEMTDPDPSKRPPLSALKSKLLELNSRDSD